MRCKITYRHTKIRWNSKNTFPRISNTPHFQRSVFSTLRIFNTPHFQHSTFSTLRIFNTPGLRIPGPRHSAYSCKPYVFFYRILSLFDYLFECFCRYLITEKLSQICYVQSIQLLATGNNEYPFLFCIHFNCRYLIDSNTFFCNRIQVWKMTFVFMEEDNWN